MTLRLISGDVVVPVGVHSLHSLVASIITCYHSFTCISYPLAGTLSDHTFPHLLLACINILARGCEIIGRLLLLVVITGVDLELSQLIGGQRDYWTSTLSGQCIVDSSERG